MVGVERVEESISRGSEDDEGVEVVHDRHDSSLARLLDRNALNAGSRESGECDEAHLSPVLLFGVLASTLACAKVRLLVDTGLPR